MKTAEPAEALAGRYVVTGSIGSGGMGQVLRARDTVLGRTVALKVLPVDLALQPGFVERFRAEAKAAARVSHPNVVGVHDWGEQDRTYFMVLEYVRGRNLRQILSRGPVHPQQACEVMAQVLQALSAAHEKGLVHRDIKPENILLSVDGVVKVTDFGIARVVEAAGLTGSLMGTVAYAAPEQARGEQVDGRTDLYSAGCVLYELLTGVMPFEGDVVSILHQHLTGRVPPPSAQVPDAAPLDAIVSRATAPAPGDRFSSAAQMRTELLTAGARLPSGPPLSSLADEVTGEVPLEALQTALPAARKKRRWIKRSLLALLLTAVASTAWYFRPTPVPDVTGLEPRQAMVKIESSGLETSTRALHSDAPEGTVIASDPAPGRILPRRSGVTIVVSAGPELTEVPAVVGSRIEAARALIREKGLVVGGVHERHDRQPAGTVLVQDPGPETVRRGDPVNLVVSKGPEIIPLPDFAGKPASEAESFLREKGFEIIKDSAFSDAPAGVVVSQDPVSGRPVPQGSTVKIVSSKGPQPFALPDFKGKSCSDARAAAQGLVLAVRSPAGQEAPCGTNRVLEQDPLPGTRVTKGREVTLYVSG